MPFQERFELLVESGQANEKSVLATKLAIELVENHYGIQMTEDVGASLVTHLATTLKQLLDGKILSKATDVVWQELEEYPEEYALAEVMVTELQRNLNLLIGRDELGFIAIHL
jgi:transcriptional regulatory protein LevR